MWVFFSECLFLGIAGGCVSVSNYSSCFSQTWELVSGKPTWASPSPPREDETKHILLYLMMGHYFCHGSVWLRGYMGLCVGVFQ